MGAWPARLCLRLMALVAALGLLLACGVKGPPRPPSPSSSNSTQTDGGSADAGPKGD